MKRERDWVDYAQLASSVAQNAQLHGIGRSLDGVERGINDLRSIELEKLSKEQRAQRFRERMFRCEDRFRTTIEKLESEPGNVKWRLFELSRFRGFEGDFSSEDITSYEDKDRLTSFGNGIKQSIQEAKAKLSAEDVATVENARTAYFEAAWLKELIETRALKSQIVPKKQRLAELQTKLRDSPMGILTAAGYIFGLIWCCISVVFFLFPETFLLTASPPISGPCFVLGLAWLVGLTLRVQGKLKPLREGVKVLQEEIASIERENEEFHLEDPDSYTDFLEDAAEDEKVAKEKGWPEDIAALKTLRLQHLEFVNQVIGNKIPPD